MVTRRALLGKLGMMGGVGVTMAAMQALGIGRIAHAQGWAPPPQIGKGTHVVVLGAGISGLTSAYELEQAGFLVTLLEARERVGGRAWTVRDGDTIEMIGEAPQTARFSNGIYFNAGPARIPSFHQGLIGYAKKFDVPLEVEVNDREKLLPFLKAYGDLGDDYAFKGTERSGFGTAPGAGVTFASAGSAMPLDQLLANQRLPMTLFEDNLYMQATMFEPVGGMDRIHAGFDRHLRHPAIRGAEVTRLRHTAKGVEIVYRDKATGSVQMVKADYVVCTIPFPVLAGIDSDFSPALKRSIAAVQYDHSNKVAFESPRFWEREQIYGGISFVGGPTDTRSARSARRR
ncbi:MAG: FAD-dependent oxidoreductase, partial [Alphaproteobacteria bacterium]